MLPGIVISFIISFIVFILALLIFLWNKDKAIEEVTIFALLGSFVSMVLTFILLLYYAINIYPIYDITPL
jgi:hypothetical protein